MCCPKTHPHLSGDLTQCVADRESSAGGVPVVGETLLPNAGGAGGNASAVPSPDGAARVNPSDDANARGRALSVGSACHSGNFTGDITIDAATCEVVGLQLVGNNLTGRLPDSIFERANLGFLAVLNLKGNRLSGALPANASYDFAWMELSNNSFKYPPPAALLASCLSGRIRCSGYPPESCDAFGEQFMPSATKALVCVECEDPWVSIVLTILIVILFILLLFVYAYFMSRHEGLTTQGVSTVSIILCHMQTVGVIGKLRLAWPPTAKVVMEWVIIDGLNLDGARPECIWRGDGGDAPMFFIGSVLKACALAFPDPSAETHIGSRCVRT